MIFTAVSPQGISGCPRREAAAMAAITGWIGECDGVHRLALTRDCARSAGDIPPRDSGCGRWRKGRVGGGRPTTTRWFRRELVRPVHETTRREAAACGRRRWADRRDGWMGAMGATDGCRWVPRTHFHTCRFVREDLPGRSSRPSTDLEWAARLRLQLRRGRLLSLPMVENEAWCRRWDSNPHDHTVKGF